MILFFLFYQQKLTIRYTKLKKCTAKNCYALVFPDDIIESDIEGFDLTLCIEHKNKLNNLKQKKIWSKDTKQKFIEEWQE